MLTSELASLDQLPSPEWRAARSLFLYSFRCFIFSIWTVIAAFFPSFSHAYMIPFKLLLID